MITVSAEYASLYSNSYNAKISESAVEKETKADELSLEADKQKEDTAVTLTLSKIQQYMSRSMQLENESREEDITAAGKLRIQNEINKINVVVSNLSIGNDSDEVENMVNSIDMTGDLVSHSRNNILSNAMDAFYAQTGTSNMEAYALLQ